MDEATIIKAKLIAAVLCRAIDYYAAASTSTKTDTDLQRKAEYMEGAERRIAVAVENMLDEVLE